MKTLFYVLPGLAVIALAYWAYSENYATQQSLREVERLQAQIGRAHSDLTILRAEWAYLNRPERLRDLAEINFDRLGLLPLAPQQFADAAQIPYRGDSLGAPLDLDGVATVDSLGALQ
ncbi:cell division protein FtsL [Palleronia sediminis]|uniref:Cell division protein FtsL n=1 Tax=Palleronia sediminis TaxID=2547833 RepID=A0A4R6AD73_9RHOB|nr:cell division protein FtsL [Palleronia sediminis]TDL81971.1 cell division protein FtsL [Palleronia sediminis]